MPQQNDSDGRAGPRRGGVNPSSDMEDLVRQGKDRLKRIVPGGGPRGAVGLVLLAVVLLGAWTAYYTVPSDSVAVVQRFGRYQKTVPAGLHFKLPLGIDAAKLASLVVVDTPFYKDPAVATASLAEEDGGMFTPGFMLEIARRGSLGLLVIGVLLGLKIVRKKPRSALAAVPAVEGQAPQGDRLLAAAQTGDPEVLRAQITQALQDNPDEVKRLFLSWVETEQGEM